MFRKSFRSFYASFLCLTGLIIGPALWSTPTPAQSPIDNANAAKLFKFEVFTIRPHKPNTPIIGWEYMPDGFRGSITLDAMITHAYDPQPPYLWRYSRMVHAPEWIDDWYDIDARVAPGDMEAWQKARVGRDSDLLNQAMRAALTECCKLTLHLTPAQMPYWNLVVDKHGAKLSETVPGAVKPVPGKTDAVGEGICIHEGEQRHFVGVTLQEFAVTLMRLTREGPIQDKTGLTGRYDFTLPWYDYARFPPSEIADPLERMPLNSIGLKLERGTGPAFVVNVDHIEKPEPD